MSKTNTTRTTTTTRTVIYLGGGFFLAGLRRGNSISEGPLTCAKTFANSTAALRFVAKHADRAVGFSGKTLSTCGAVVRCITATTTTTDFSI